MNIAEKLTTISENMSKVYDAGLSLGNVNGYQIGYNDFLNTFWDDMQQNGNRTDYTRAFIHWTDAMFTPKYDIVPTGTGAQDMFTNAKITDLAGILESRGVNFDLSNITSAWGTFAYSTITTLPPLNLSNCANMTTAFRDAANLETIVLINPGTNIEGKSCLFDRTFNGCKALKNVKFLSPSGENWSGVINNVANSSYGLYFKDSPNLTTDSVSNIIAALGTPTNVNKVVFNQDTLDRAIAESVNNPVPVSLLITIMESRGWQINP